MAEYLKKSGLEDFMDTAKGAGWFKSKEVQAEAMDYFSNHMLFTAWGAIFSKNTTPCYIHCKVEMPRLLTDISYWSVTGSPLLPREVVSVWRVDVQEITPSKISGRFDIVFSMTTPSETRGKWMKFRNVPYRSFDPFLQYWLKRGAKDSVGVYTLDAGTSQVRTI